MWQQVAHEHLRLPAESLGKRSTFVSVQSNSDRPFAAIVDIELKVVTPQATVDLCRTEVSANRITTERLDLHHVSPEVSQYRPRARGRHETVDGDNSDAFQRCTHDRQVCTRSVIKHRTEANDLHTEESQRSLIRPGFRTSLVCDDDQRL